MPGTGTFFVIIFLVTNTNTLLSGLYFISTASMSNCHRQLYSCQCPLGLIPHFYVTADITSWRDDSKCQCPLGLIPHFYFSNAIELDSNSGSVNALSGLYLISTHHVLRSLLPKCVNALSGLYLISTVPLQKPRFYAVSRACFCRYLSEYSDNSRFSCMLTFWTYLMRCTYPWHWIKYSTNYNRCHPIFFTLLINWAEQ